MRRCVISPEEKAKRDAKIRKVYAALVAAGEGNFALRFTAQRFGLTVWTVSKVINQKEE